MKKTLTVIFGFGFISNVIGQSVVQKAAVPNNNALINGTVLFNERSGSMLYTYNDRYDGVEGNRFFYDDNYHEGELWLTNKRHYTTEYQYKFDQLVGTIQVKDSKGKEILLNIKDVLSFQMKVEDKFVTFVKVLMPKTQEMKIVQVIYWSENMHLLRDIKKKLQREKASNAYSDGKVVDKIVSDYQYYAGTNNEDIILIKTHKKGFIKAFPKKERNIESLFKQKKYNDDMTVSKLAELMQTLDKTENKE